MDRKTNLERVLVCIRQHPDGIDDDEISKITRIRPRQQVHQLASRLASQGLTRRESVVKSGKRKKIHNFPVPPGERSRHDLAVDQGPPQSLWKRRLAALVAATGLTEDQILDQALEFHARRILGDLLKTS